MSHDAEVTDLLVDGNESMIKGGFLMNVKSVGIFAGWGRKVRIERNITGTRKGRQVLRGSGGGL